MSAAAIGTDRDLEERIFQLQRLHLDAGLRQIVDEACQLCGEGRYIEAAALVEKADALRAASANNDSAPEPDGSSTDVVPIDEDWASRLVADVADGIAKVMVGAIQKLERRVTGETRRFADAFSERLDQLRATVESLQPLALTAASLQEANARHEAEIGGLRTEVREGAAATSQRFDEVWSRITGTEQEVSGVKSSLSEFASHVQAAAGRLDRHAEVLRSLVRAHQERNAHLEQLADVLSRLKTSPLPTVSL
jgi:methyl-accepting chemotaxis protein